MYRIYMMEQNLIIWLIRMAVRMDIILLELQQDWLPVGVEQKLGFLLEEKLEYVLEDLLERLSVVQS